MPNQTVTARQAEQVALFKSLRFGVEVETIGPGRRQVAHAVAATLGVGFTTRYTGGGYDVWEVVGPDGRAWKFMRDGSLNDNFNGEYGGCEIVSPILTYADIDLLQKVVRAAKAAGSKVDSQCGIHVHVDAARLEGNDLVKLAETMFRRQDALFKALRVRPSREVHFCRKLSVARVEKLQKRRGVSKNATGERSLNAAWYGYYNERPAHYDGTRYHALNLHSVWTKGTVEFRLFNSTLHAGKVKAYAQLALAIVAHAKLARSAVVANQPLTREAMRVFLWRLGFLGDEFKTVRHHLLANYSGPEQAATDEDADTSEDVPEEPRSAGPLEGAEHPELYVPACGEPAAQEVSA